MVLQLILIHTTYFYSHLLPLLEKKKIGIDIAAIKFKMALICS